ncbi:DUF6894 family protein [Sphingomonas sp. ACRSK]|uniref:DUF6894 family protein n=1 Tax=Sphingomonas sp. ACRSK TaxID=2918213 RepID=UPI00406CE6AF
MPRYFINLRTGSHVASSTEVKREDLTKLRLELAKFVGEVLKDHAEQIWSDELWQIEATDESGLILLMMHVSASGTPATRLVPAAPAGV